MDLVWSSPFPLLSFALCAADGTVLAELPPTARIESSIGKPEPRQPPTPQKAGRSAVGTTVKRVLSTAADGVQAGTKTRRVTEISDVAEDYYTWERAPFSSEWFALGDGLPTSRPKDDSGTTTLITEEDGKTVTEATTKSRTVAGGKTTTVTEVRTTTELGTGGAGTTETTITEENGERVTETVHRQPATVGGQPGMEVITTTSTETTDGGARYVVSEPYWGAAPAASLTQTSDLQAAYTAAYDHNLSTRREVWVLERRGGEYDVLEKFEAPPAPQLILAAAWYYQGGGDEMLMHADELERALDGATQLMLRGRTLVTLDPARPSRMELKTADRMRDVTYTFTLNITDYFTAAKFAGRQLA